MVESLGRNVEPNCIRLGRDLPGSEGPGRVCEGMEANTKVEIEIEVENEDARGMERRAKSGRGEVEDKAEVTVRDDTGCWILDYN